MNVDDFANSPSGRLTPTINGAYAFVPHPLPPKINLSGLVKSLEKATHALGELSGIGHTIPNPDLLIRPFSRKEALASSRIEGTVTSLHELLNLELEADAKQARPDTREVRNYTSALHHGLQRLDVLPVSKRLIQEMHTILLKDVDPHRGAHIEPGQFKRDQNWIAGRTIHVARFVPPPPPEATTCLDHLEKYINNDHDLPLLVKLALIHYQFETIHPFPDGNGRVGRLLIPLILCERKAMSQPLLYLSDFFERNFTAYIELMLQVSKTGTWEPWIEFFLQGILESATDAISKARSLQALRREYHAKLQTARTSALLAKLVDELFLIPAINIPIAMRALGISYNSAKNNILKLEELGILDSDRAGRPRWLYATKIMYVGYGDDSP